MNIKISMTVIEYWNKTSCIYLQHLFKDDIYLWKSRILQFPSFISELIYSIFKTKKLWLCRTFNRDSSFGSHVSRSRHRRSAYAVKRNYAWRVVKAHRGRFYERLRGIIINELKCGWRPLSLPPSSGRRLATRGCARPPQFVRTA